MNIKFDIEIIMVDHGHCIVMEAINKMTGEYIAGVRSPHSKRYDAQHFFSELIAAGINVQIEKLKGMQK